VTQKRDHPESIPNRPAHAHPRAAAYRQEGQLWREPVLGRYLRGQIDRAQAVETLGADWVELAERQQGAVREDLEWAREQGRSS
jgi:hypothetical protein